MFDNRMTVLYWSLFTFIISVVAVGIFTVLGEGLVSVLLVTAVVLGAGWLFGYIINRCLENS